MSPMRLIVLAVAAVAAIIAAMLVRGLAGGEGAGPREIFVEREVEVASAQVLTVVRDVQIGELLTPEDLRWAPWPQAALNPLFLTEEASPNAFEEISGSVVRTPLFENEPILPQKVVLKGDTGYMAALLTPGKRAISIEISAESASGGFILPNDRVDVVVTYREPENFDLSAFADNGVDVVISEDSMTATVLENVRILAIDQIFRQTDTGETAVGRVATLELTPEDAKLLSHTTKEGAVTLLLRSLRDAQAAGDEVISNRFMYDIDQNTRRRTGQVTIYRNGKATTQDEGAGL